MAMLVVAVFLGLSLALILEAKLARMRDTSYKASLDGGIFFCCLTGLPLIYFIIPLAGKHPALLPIATAFALAAVVQNLIAALRSKKQAMPPRVSVTVQTPGQNPRVERAVQEVARFLVVWFLVCFPFQGNFTFRGHLSGWDMLAYGIFAMTAIVRGLHLLFLRDEICGTGLLDPVGYGSKFRPWEAYKSFSCTEATRDGVQLRLQAKSPDRKTSPLTVRFEDREAVRQILEANFPDQSSGDYDGLHRRTSCPCVRVRRTRRSRFTRHIVSFLCWPAVVLLTFYLWRRGVSLEVFSGIGMVSILVTMGVNFWAPERIEICGNGLLLGEKLRPWDQYECFFWEGETEDGVELRLPLKPSTMRRSISVERLVVAPEDRETVRRLLEANLQDRSADSEAYEEWPVS